MATLPVTEHTRPPFWRDERVLTVIAQIIFLVVVVLVFTYLYNNVQEGLRARGLTGGYGFLQQRAGFDIGESLIPYTSDDSYGRAFVVGILNTLKVSLVGILFATLLGLLSGIARLSPNWLLRTLVSAYIEIIRNTPLLVQLFFWYMAVMLKFPRVRQAVQLPGPVYLSNRGIAIPWLQPQAGFPVWVGFVVAGVVVGLVVAKWRARYEERTGQSGYPIVAALGTWVVFVLVGWLIAPGTPASVTRPELVGLNFQGGTRMTPEFAALFTGLVVYTGAFIAEIVRGGILAVSKGQREAAKALGLNDVQMMRYIILPQALRIIIPPLTSQYLNLTKNSSLAVFIGYPDLFFVAGTVLNQTGKSLEVISLVMASYLTFSLFTSLFMNWYNQKVKLVER